MPQREHPGRRCRMDQLDDLFEYQDSCVVRVWFGGYYRRYCVDPDRVVYTLYTDALQVDLFRLVRTNVYYVLITTGTDLQNKGAPHYSTFYGIGAGWSGFREISQSREWTRNLLDIQGQTGTDPENCEQLSETTLVEGGKPSPSYSRYIYLGGLLGLRPPTTPRWVR